MHLFVFFFVNESTGKRILRAKTKNEKHKVRRRERKQESDRKKRTTEKEENVMYVYIKVIMQRTSGGENGINKTQGEEKAQRRETNYRKGRTEYI